MAVISSVFGDGLLPGGTTLRNFPAVGCLRDLPRRIGRRTPWFLIPASNWVLGFLCREEVGGAEPLE